MKKIIAFSGSNSSKSINQQLVKIAATYIKGAEVEILTLRDYPAVIFGEDEEKENGFPETMKALHQKMETADGFIVSSPEHNGSMPAVLKNTIDWLSRIGVKVFQEKPTVFLATSPGPRGGASVLNHLLTIMPYRGAKIVGGYALGDFSNKVEDGSLIDGDDQTAIRELMEKLKEVI